MRPFGTYWKFLFVGLILSSLLYLILISVTDNVLLSGVVSASFILILLIYIYYQAEIAFNEEQEDKKRHQEKMKNMADQVVVDPKKCMSCLQKLDDGVLMCTNCGFINDKI